jgi:hypothetical protein
MGKTRIKGTLTAQLPLPGRSVSVARRVADGPDLEPVSDVREGFEFKAAIEADATGASSSDLTLTFDQGGRPQVLAGSLRASWRKALDVQTDLSSRWLDLDRLAGATEGSVAIDGLAKLVAWARGLVPADGRVRARIDIARANLGGEPVGPVRLRLAQSASKLDIQALRIELPGSNVDLKGDIAGPADALAFKGRLNLRGTSAARFLAWATGRTLSLDAKGDGAFDIRTGLVVDAAHVAAPDLTGNLAGTALGGTLRYRWAGRPELVVALEGPKLDARGLVPEGFSLLDAFDRLSKIPFAQQAEGRTPGGVGADLDLRVKAGQLITAARTYRDVSAVVDMKGGNLEQLRLRLSGDEGYGLELEGAVDALVSRPEGSLHGSVMAETAAGIAPLAELLGVPVAFRPGESRERAIIPLRLAGTITFGDRTPTAADLVVDGEANEAAVRVDARSDGGTTGWRSGRADLTASLESANVTKLTELLFAGASRTQRVDGTRPGRIVIRASGTPSAGLATAASLDTGDVALSFQGRFRATETGARAEGGLEVRASSGAPLAALAGLAPPLQADGVPVSGKLDLVVDGSSISLEKLALQVGAARLSGRVALADAGGRRRIDADLDTDEATVAGLLGLLLDRRLEAAGAAEAMLQGRQNPWPNEPFSASVLDGFEGRIRLSCKRLTLAEGLALDRAKIVVALQPGKLDVKEIAGAGPGGEFKATLSVDKAAAGAEVHGSLGFKIALEDVASGSPPRASGPMSGSIRFAGRGSSPRAVISALRGEGSVTFGDAKLAALWPGAVETAADAALKAESGKLVATVRQGLAEGLGMESLPLERRTVDLEIADGQLRSKSLVVDTAKGRASGMTRIDLERLTLDSQWQLEAPPAAGADGKPLPGVTVSYQGPVASLGTLGRQIDTAKLEQELADRKFAQEMEKLEELRRLEEQRRLDETERLRKQFEKVPPIPRPPPAPAVPVAPSNRAQPANPG